MSNDYGRWETLKWFKDDGTLKSRVAMMFGYDSLGQIREKGLAFGTGDGGLRVGGIKFILSEARGRMQPPLAELKEQTLAAHDAGFQLAIHCVEPGTVEAAISTLEYIASRSSIEGRRHRLEHLSECPPELLERLQRLKALVVTQPVFIYQNGERYLGTVSPQRRRWLYRVKSFHDAVSWLPPARTHRWPTITPCSASMPP